MNVWPPDCAKLTLGIANPTFLFYALRRQKTRQWLIDNSQSSALTNINQSIADNIPVPIPALSEQIAIAEILSDMDAEIAALERKRDKTRLLKQGMMQELLTGKDQAGVRHPHPNPLPLGEGDAAQRVG